MICILQFDAASASLLERMLTEQRLPALAGLAERGRRHELAGPASAFAAAAFPTLYSGVEAADHGIFYPFQWSAADQRARYTTAFEAPPAVWERLASVDRSTLAVDPYECRPPANPNGLFVSGWGFAERVVLPRWSRPHRAGRKLSRRFGRSPGATEIFGTPRPADLSRLRERLLPAPARVAALACEKLDQSDYDLAWLTFSASHIGGHAFWDLSQVPPEELSDRDAELLGSTLPQLYEAVDAAFATVLARLGPADSVIAVSPVGMEVNTSRADLLPGMLAAVLSGEPLPEHSDAGAIWRLRAAVPPGFRRRVAEALPAKLALELTARLELRGHDWSQTRAFAHPADNQGYVRLNLRGRERDGIVDPADADALIEEIAAGLMTFNDPDGSPAVADVARVADEFRGARADLLPDLVVRWSERPATDLGYVSSPGFGRVERRGTGSGRSGNHSRGDAWAIAIPGEGARHADREAAPARLVDVAATICELTGAPAGGLRGTPLLTTDPAR